MPAPDPLTPAEDALLDKIAGQIVKRGLVAPAILFLESIRPMNFVASQGMAFFGPFAGILFNPLEYDTLRELLERRESIEHIISRIEQHDADRTRAKKAQKESPGQDGSGSSDRGGSNTAKG